MKEALRRKIGIVGAFGLIGGFLKLLGFFLPQSDLCVEGGGCRSISMFDMLATGHLLPIVFLIFVAVVILCSLFLEGRKRGSALILLGLGMSVLPAYALMHYFSLVVNIPLRPVVILDLAAGLTVLSGGLLYFFTDFE